MAPPNLKSLIQVKIKPRQDSYSDQFSRIVMVKMLMLTAAVTGISWMNDNLNCIVPGSHDTTGSFVTRACWINGLYVYRDLKLQDESFYYGVPQDISKDGTNSYGDLCSTKTKGGQQKNPDCKPLEKTFFLQYQWFPIGVAALGFLYYLPYLFFRLVNADLQELKNTVKDKTVEEVNFDEVIRKFFKRKGNNSVSHLRTRVVLNILVKVIYVIVNVIGMITIDSAVNGYFMGYGGKWVEWSKQTNEGQHDYTRVGENKAGHQLLPGFALCQVQTAGQDIKNVVANVHTYVCELSQHVLYQYILLVLWYMFIVGIVVSLAGLLKHLYDVVAINLFSGKGVTEVEHVYQGLTSREKEYMDFIKRKNMPIFGKMIKKLHDQMYGGSMPSESDRSSYDTYPEEK